MTFESQMSEIISLAKRISKDAPSSKWYVFGSAKDDRETASDIDVLVIYETDKDALLIRSAVDRLEIAPPIHIIMFAENEREADAFILKVGATEIFPEDRLIHRHRA